jgi:hypothetical protein
MFLDPLVHGVWPPALLALLEQHQVTWEASAEERGMRMPGPRRGFDPVRIVKVNPQLIDGVLADNRQVLQPYVSRPAGARGLAAGASRAA